VTSPDSRPESNSHRSSEHVPVSNLWHPVVSGGVTVALGIRTLVSCPATRLVGVEVFAVLPLVLCGASSFGRLRVDCEGGVALGFAKLLSPRVKSSRACSRTHARIISISWSVAFLLKISPSAWWRFLCRQGINEGNWGARAKSV
jgi:hypothetical protein